MEGFPADVAADLFAGALVFLVVPAMLYYLSGGRAVLSKLFYGARNCPECHSDYAAPLLGLNLGGTRYERCPHCRHWHWTKPRAV